MIQRLRAAIAARRDEMAQLVAGLVAVPTENPPGVEYERAIRLFATACQRLGFDAVVQRVPGDDDGHARWWLRAFCGGGPRTVHFHGHIDVVPANAPGLFEPHITDDTIFGRGSSDMKGGLVSMLYAMHAISDSGAELNGRIALTVVPDEETGGARGSHLIDIHQSFPRRSTIYTTSPATCGSCIREEWRSGPRQHGLKLRRLPRRTHAQIRFSSRLGWGFA